MEWMGGNRAFGPSVVQAFENSPGSHAPIGIRAWEEFIPLVTVPASPHLLYSSSPPLLYQFLRALRS